MTAPPPLMGGGGMTMSEGKLTRMDEHGQEKPVDDDEGGGCTAEEEIVVKKKKKNDRKGSVDDDDTEEEEQIVPVVVSVSATTSSESYQQQVALPPPDTVEEATAADGDDDNVGLDNDDDAAGLDDAGDRMVVENDDDDDDGDVVPLRQDDGNDDDELREGSAETSTGGCGAGQRNAGETTTLLHVVPVEENTPSVDDVDAASTGDTTTAKEDAFGKFVEDVRNSWGGEADDDTMIVKKVEAGGEEGEDESGRKEVVVEIAAESGSSQEEDAIVSKEEESSTEREVRGEELEGKPVLCLEEEEEQEGCQNGTAGSSSQGSTEAEIQKEEVVEVADSTAIAIIDDGGTNANATKENKKKKNGSSSGLCTDVPSSSMTTPDKLSSAVVFSDEDENATADVGKEEETIQNNKEEEEGVSESTGGILDRSTDTTNVEIHEGNKKGIMSGGGDVPSKEIEDTGHDDDDKGEGEGKIGSRAAAADVALSVTNGTDKVVDPITTTDDRNQEEGGGTNKEIMVAEYSASAEDKDGNMINGSQHHDHNKEEEDKSGKEETVVPTTTAASEEGSANDDPTGRKTGGIQVKPEAEIKIMDESNEVGVVQSTTTAEAPASVTTVTTSQLDTAGDNGTVQQGGSSSPPASSPGHQVEGKEEGNKLDDGTDVHSGIQGGVLFQPAKAAAAVLGDSLVGAVGKADKVGGEIHKVGSSAASEEHEVRKHVGNARASVIVGGKDDVVGDASRPPIPPAGAGHRSDDADEQQDEIADVTSRADAGTSKRPLESPIPPLFNPTSSGGDSSPPSGTMYFKERVFGTPSPVASPDSPRKYFRMGSGMPEPVPDQGGASSMAQPPINTPPRSSMVQIPTTTAMDMLTQHLINNIGPKIVQHQHSQVAMSSGYATPVNGPAYPPNNGPIPTFAPNGMSTYAAPAPGYPQVYAPSPAFAPVPAPASTGHPMLSRQGSINPNANGGGEGGGRRSIRLRLIEEKTEIHNAKDTLFQRGLMRRNRAQSMGSFRSLLAQQQEEAGETIREIDHGTITVSWYDGTTTAELQEHVRSSMLRTLMKERVDHVRLLDESVAPGEVVEVVLSPHIPDGSRFTVKFILPEPKPVKTIYRYGERAPDSPSAAPSPSPSTLNLDKLPPLKLFEDEEDEYLRSKKTPQRQATLPPGPGSTQKGEQNMMSGTLVGGDAKEEVLIVKATRSQEKKHVVFMLANYFVLFLSLIAVSAELHDTIPRWVMDQMGRVNSCAVDRDTLFECVSNGDVSGLIASFFMWMSKSATAKRFFLFGFNSRQQLWTVVYEALVTAVCWGTSYMFIRRGLNPDTRTNFLSRYWKDAVYGSLAGFNAYFMKAVLKNLIPKEALEDVLETRQLRIVDWVFKLIPSGPQTP